MKFSLRKIFSIFMVSVLLSMNVVFAAAPTQGITIFKTGTKNTAYTISLADIQAGYNDADGDPLQKIQIVNLGAANAALKLSGVDVTLFQEIPVASISNLTFVPVTGYVGAAAFDFISSDGTSYSNPQSSYIINFVNNAPTLANAIPDQNATEDIFFSYSCPNNTFNDADGDTLTLSATKTDGSALPAWVTFTSATCTFSGTPANADVGTLQVRLTATDVHGGTVFDDFNITVANVNDAPTVANAIPNQTATQNTAFSYACPNNTFNDVDGDTLTLSATKTDGSALPFWLSFTSGTCTFSGTPANADVGVVPVRVTANDGHGGTVFTDFTITVANVNDAPTVANLIPDQVTGKNQLFSYAFPANTFNDIDGDTLTYSALLNGGGALPAWLTFTPGTRTFSGTPGASDVGSINIAVTANDGNGGTVSDVFQLTVNNAAPTQAAVNSAGLKNIAKAFTLAEFASSFSDSDGDTIQKIEITSAPNPSGTLTLSSVSLVFPQEITAANIPNLLLTPVTAYTGNVSFQFRSYDGNVYSPLATFTVNFAETNHAPTVANTIPDQVATAAQAFSYSCPNNTFNDTDGDTLALSATLQGGGALPAWLTFTPGTCNFAGTATNADVGVINITVTANDGIATVSDTFQLTVNPAANSAPTLANLIPDQVATVPNAFSYAFPANTFNDGDGDTLTYSALLQAGGALPAWLNFTSGTRTFAGTPTNANVGAINITVTANDGHGGTVSDTFQLTVNPAANNAPTVANLIPDQTVTVPNAFSYSCPANTFNDVDGDTLSYTAVLQGGGALPAWLTFTPGTCNFAGTPTAGDVGAIDITVTANDGHGGSVSDTFKITVNPAAGGGGGNNVPTVANAIPDQVATVPNAFSYSFPANTFNDTDGDTLSYTAVLQGGGALPAWLTFTSGTRTFAGTPTNANVGAINITVTANDGHGGTVSDTFQLTVNPAGNHAPTVIATIPDQITTVPNSYSYNCSTGVFNDSDGDTLTYSALLQSGGALPAWLTFTPGTCNFAGTPAAGDVGAIDITVTANDGHGGSVSDTFKITVNPAAVFSSGGGGGGGGVIVLPDFSQPTKLYCPSSVNNQTVLYTPIDFKNAKGEFCQPILHENYYQHHKVFYSKGTKVNVCETKKPFDEILYVAKTLPLSQTNDIPVPQGKELVRAVDLSSGSQDLCFEGKTLPEFTIRFYMKGTYDPAKLSVYRYNPSTKTVDVVSSTPKVDLENSEVSFPVTKTGIYALFYGDEPKQQCFKDIQNSPAKDDIYELLSQGVLDCKEFYNPDMGVTRAEITKYALKAFKRMQDTNFPISYPDTFKDQWYYPYVARGTELGIIHGYPHDGYFRPAQVVKRGEALKIVLLASEFNTLQGKSSFIDVSASDWYAHFADFSSAKNILDFMNESSFDAGRDVTRAEIATMIVRTQQALQAMEKIDMGSIQPLSQSQSLAVNDKISLAFQLLNSKGEADKKSGVPMWCQLSADQKDWHFFGTLTFTNSEGIATCTAQVIKTAKLYFRGYRYGMDDRNLANVLIEWK